MPALSKAQSIFLWTVGLLRLLSLPVPVDANMDNLPSSFTIVLNGSPVAKIADDSEDRVQATLGTEPAVFTLKDGRLECGSWALGRNITENRSFLPKKVLWFKSNEHNANVVQPVTAHEDGDSFKLKFAGTWEHRDPLLHVTVSLTITFRCPLDCRRR